MKYMLLIYEDETHYASEAAMGGIVAQHRAFGAEAGAAIVGGNGLKATAAATTVRRTAGQHAVHDGPFAETKEQLGGYYIVDLPDLDAAIALARKVPLAADGAIEIRPLLGPA